MLNMLNTRSENAALSNIFYYLLFHFFNNKTIAS